jgi:PKD repeat protein
LEEETSSLTLSAAEKEIEEYVPPDGVNKALFQSLAARFVEDLAAARTRGRSQAGLEQPPLDLVVSSDETATTFRWNYFNRGDYDLSGTVGISDITPIANHYLERRNVKGEFPNVEDEFVDGDENDEIGVGDITAIANNYLNDYAILIGVFTEAPDTSWTADEFKANALAETETAVGRSTFILHSDPGDPGFGFVEIEFENDTLPPDEGIYYFAVRTASDPPRFYSFERYIVGTPRAPIIEGVTPTGGCQGEEITFSVNLAAGLPPFNYDWNFGGGATPDASTDESPVVLLGAKGKYNGMVTLTNEWGGDSLSFTIEVTGFEPTISTVTPIAGLTGALITPVATVTGKPPFTYSWDFGGGATPDTSPDESPGIELGAIGAYDATLTVTNAYGGDDYPFTLTVNGAPPDITAVSPLSGDLEEEITISATITGDGPFTYAWDFGAAAEPATSSEASPTIGLGRVGGVYNCSLDVSSAWGADTFDFQVTLNDIPLPPKVHSVNPTSGLEGVQIVVNSIVSGEQPIDYSWNFGSGASPNTSTNPNPAVSLGSAGSYAASLVVTNSLGSETYNFTLKVTGSGGGWITEVVDGGAPTGFGTSLVFLETGEPMIAYVHQIASGNRGLKVAKYTGDAWEYQVVDDADGGYAGFFPSIALDHGETGNPVISYQYSYDTSFAPQFDMNVAWWDGTAWVISLVEGDGKDPEGLNRCGNNSNIQFNPDGTGHIGHWRAIDKEHPNQLRSLKWDSSSWVGKQVKGGVPYECCSTLLSDGRAVFVMKGSGATIDSFWETETTNWTRKQVWSGRHDAGMFSMATDSAEYPAIAWYDYDGVITDGDLLFAKWDGSAWLTPETIWGGTDDVGAYCSLTYAPDDTPWISFNKCDTNELWVAYKVGEEWTTEVVDAGGTDTYRTGRYTCIRFGPDGKPHISYQQYETGHYALKYASLQ